MIVFPGQKPATLERAPRNQKTKIENRKSLSPCHLVTFSPRHPRRGIALLLVMIGLVVCSILTAGFLSSQGTAIGIARNERDAEKARAVAQSGIDMCYWLMINRPDWRTAIAPGTWLNNVAVGDGSVTVTAASGDATSSFANDLTQPAIFTSVGTVSNRTFTLTATIGPTGGGTVFRGGNYAKGRIILGNNDLAGAAVVDSYNSAVAPYNILLPGANALFGTDYTSNYGLLVYFLSAYRGSFVGSSKQNLSNSVYGTLGAILPVATTIASQDFVPGFVVFPNYTGLATYGAYSKTSSTTLGAPGTYSAFTLSPTGIVTTNVNITTSGIYHITGNLTINNLANLIINDGVNATIVVDGAISLTGSIKLTGAATLNLYASGNITLNSSAGLNATAGNTSNCTLFGSGGSLTLNGTSQINGAIYMPQTSVVLQNLTPKVYGAIISKSLTLSDSSAFHFDQNLQTKRLDNITGGSAPAGNADYNVAIVGSTSLGSH